MTHPSRLAEAYGSPAYVYQLHDLDRAAADLRAALPDGAVLYYSLKANPHPEIARRLMLAGCHAEVSSSGETQAAVTAGFDAGTLLYTGPAKTPPEIRAAMARGVGLFSAESGSDYRHVCEAAAATGAAVRCLVRVNAPAVAAGGLRMSGPVTQFGTDLERLLRAPGVFAPRDGCRVAGLHFFAASNLRDEDGLITQAQSAVRAAALLRDAGYPVEMLDLGGGFAAPYGVPGLRPRYHRFRDQVESALDDWFPRWRTGSPLIAFESGRYLVAVSGTLVATVTETKVAGGRRYLLLDSGINHLGGLSGLGRVTVRDGIRPQLASEEPRPLEPVTIAGPLCTPADVLARDAPIGPVAEGSLVAIPNVGAYGLTASLIGFLSRPAPLEVVLDGDVVVSATRLQLSRTPCTRTDELDGGAP